MLKQINRLAIGRARGAKGRQTGVIKKRLKNEGGEARIPHEFDPRIFGLAAYHGHLLM